MRERDDEILQKEQARHIMLAPLRGQQLKNYVTGIRNQLNSEKLAEKKRAYNEAFTKYELCVYLHIFMPIFDFLLLYVTTSVWMRYSNSDKCSYKFHSSLSFVFSCRAKEQKARLYEARLKALAGEEDDS